VATGDLLVRLDIPTAAMEVSRQQAEVARIQALVENSRVAQTRARDLADRGIISRREMEDADREVTVAQAELARAQAARAAAEASAERALLRAPFGGTVAQRFHNPGDLVQGLPADPILRIVDPARLEVTATVPAADAPRILPGATARLTAVDAVMPVRLIVALRPVVTPGSADALVRLTFAEPATIPVDTRAEIEIDGEEHVNAILVKPEALIKDGNQVALVVASGDRAERRTVTVGLTGDDYVEITSGLSAGELVVTSGQSGLSTGDKISVEIRR
jgi:RND family efflux transporter MFP subunit